MGTNGNGKWLPGWPRAAVTALENVVALTFVVLLAWGLGSLAVHQIRKAERRAVEAEHVADSLRVVAKAALERARVEHEHALAVADSFTKSATVMGGDIQKYLDSVQERYARDQQARLEAMGDSAAAASSAADSGSAVPALPPGVTQALAMPPELHQCVDLLQRSLGVIAQGQRAVDSLTTDSEAWQQVATAERARADNAEARLKAMTPGAGAKVLGVLEKVGLVLVGYGAAHVIGAAVGH